MAATTVPFVLPTVVVGAAFLALLPDGMAWHGTGDDRRARVLQHCGGRSARRLDDRRDPARSRRCRRAHWAPRRCRRPRLVMLPLLQTGAVVGGSGDLPVQLHVVRCRQAARRADAPDAGGRDRAARHATGRCRRRGRAVGGATGPAGHRDRVDVSTSTTRRRSNCTERPRRDRPRGRRERTLVGAVGRGRSSCCRRTDRRARQPIVRCRQRLVAVGVDASSATPRCGRAPASASTPSRRSRRPCGSPSSPR